MNGQASRACDRYATATGKEKKEVKKMYNKMSWKEKTKFRKENKIVPKKVLPKNERLKKEEAKIKQIKKGD